MDQWKAKREAVGENTTCVKTQTADINPSTDETTQTDQHNSMYFFFLLGLRPLHISCVGVGGLSPISISGVYSGKRSTSALERNLKLSHMQRLMAIVQLVENLT
jgi:hypothetical protein